MMETITQWLQLHFVDDFVDKRKLKEQLCLLTAHASLLHVEESGIVELTYRATMRTLHVVGINLQHWLGEHAGLLGGTKVLVGFLRYRLLGTMANQHTTGECSTSLIIEYILVKLVAGAMTYLMVDEGIVIHHLVLIGNHATIQEALCTLALERKVETVASDTIM